MDISHRLENNPWTPLRRICNPFFETRSYLLRIFTNSSFDDGTKPRLNIFPYVRSIVSAWRASKSRNSGNHFPVSDLLSILRALGSLPWILFTPKRVTLSPNVILLSNRGVNNRRFHRRWFSTRLMPAHTNRTISPAFAERIKSWLVSSVEFDIKWSRQWIIG